MTRTISSSKTLLASASMNQSKNDEVEIKEQQFRERNISRILDRKILDRKEADFFKMPQQARNYTQSPYQIRPIKDSIFGSPPSLTYAYTSYSSSIATTTSLGNNNTKK